MASDSIAVTLRPSPYDDASNDSIASILSRLTHEKGVGWLKETTEESVLDSIAAASSTEKPASDSEDDSSDTQPQQTSYEQRRAFLFTKSVELRGLGNEAWSETNKMANATSLLLSKYSGRNAVEPSMLADDRLHFSRAFDTMGFDVVNAAAERARNEKRPAEEKAKDLAQKRRNEEIAMGWKIDVLDKTARKVSAAAKRLNDEMEKEKKYWSSLIGLQEDGWSLTRTRQRGVLGVRYGFSEGRAATAALKVGEDGAVKLDTGLGRNPRYIRVKIMQSGEVESSSVVPCAAPDDAPLEAVIKQARDTLFEEELFQELVREAPTMLGAGVKHVDQSIVAPLESQSAPALSNRALVIDLTPLPSPPLSLGEPKSAANVIAVSLRLLLSNLHNRRHTTRTRPPLPLPKVPAKEKHKPRVPPTNDLLRTILNIYDQSAAVTRVLSALRPIFNAISTTGLKNALDLETKDLASSSPLSLISALASSDPGSIRLSLPNETITIRIAAKSPPLIGTIFNVTHSPAPENLDTEMSGTDVDTRASDAAIKPSLTSAPRPFEDPAALTRHVIQSIQFSILHHLRLQGGTGTEAQKKETWYIVDGDEPILQSKVLIPAAELNAQLEKEGTERQGEGSSGAEKDEMRESVISTRNVSVKLKLDTALLTDENLHESEKAEAKEREKEKGKEGAVVELSWGREGDCTSLLGRWSSDVPVARGIVEVFVEFAKGV